MRSPVPPTWKTIGMRASSARAHTPSSAMWLGECRGGQPEATSRAAAGAGRDRLLGQRRGQPEVGERDVAGGQQPGVDRAELQHPPVVGPGGADGQLEVAAVLAVVEAAVVEGVEDELAGEPEVVE